MKLDKIEIIMETVSVDVANLDISNCQPIL